MTNMNVVMNLVLIREIARNRGISSDRAFEIGLLSSMVPGPMGFMVALLAMGNEGGTKATGTANPTGGGTTGGGTTGGGTSGGGTTGGGNTGGGEPGVVGRLPAGSTAQTTQTGHTAR